MTKRFDYIQDPEAIYRASFETIRAEAALAHLPDDIADVSVRLIHACGMPDIVEDLTYTDDVVNSAREALASGAAIIADSRMVASGVIERRLPADNAVLCTLNDPGVAEQACAKATTRSAAAVDLWRDHLQGSVVSIGNAPTALFRLLELLADGAQKPAAIFAFPVGFVGAAESKAALIESAPAPYLTLRGRRGGSAMAAAAVNALASE